MKAPDTIYRLRRLTPRPGSCEVFVGDDKKIRNGRMLNHRLDLWNHSPSGLEWGYAGSGPAQCALAILADFLEDDVRAKLLHQKFKFAVVARMPEAGGEISGAQIMKFLEDLG